jgi:hypothetical protein
LVLAYKKQTWFITMRHLKDPASVDIDIYRKQNIAKTVSLS